MLREPCTSYNSHRLDDLQKDVEWHPGMSQLHTHNTLSAAAIEPPNLSKLLQDVLEQAQNQGAESLVPASLPWLDNIPKDPDALWPWLKEAFQYNHAQSSEGESCVLRAEAQAALDVLLASICIPGEKPPSDSAVNTNWCWDHHGRPKLPEAPELTLLQHSPTNDDHDTELSDTARLLLAEWPLGADPAEYVYRNPYQGLDFAPEEEEEQPTPSASQPARPTVHRASQKPRVVSRRAPHPADLGSSPIPARRPLASQEEAPPRSSQDSEADPFGAVQTQIEPGRFAQRSAGPKPPKRKKRLGGF